MGLNSLWSKAAGLLFGNRTRRRDQRLHTRHCHFETFEPRRVLSAAPLFFGGVFIEEDMGSDLHGDTFEITFVGGAPGTELKRIIINGDQWEPGFSRGDIIFDTEPGGLGADLHYPFTIISAEGIDEIRWFVEDGSSLLIVEFSGFHAGDKLVFQIDTDEVEIIYPGETNLTKINRGIDPIVSGVEFEGTTLTAEFSAPHYQDIAFTATYHNYYDEDLEGTGLNLSPDNVDGKRDRTAGAVGQVVQIPKPITLSGTVWHDVNLDLVRGPGEQGISGVALSLWRYEEGGSVVFTGHTATTDALGRYHFGEELGLMPGTYQIRQTQPAGYFSVGAVPGSVAGETVGVVVSGDPNVLGEITVPLGDLHAINYDFAEAQPAALSGYVYHDRNQNGLREAGEEGIAGVTVQIVAVDTIAPQSTVTVTTNASGYYEATGLAPGLYRVIEVQPPGWLDGLDSAGTVGGIVVGAAVNPGDRIEGVFLGGNQVGVEYNFGELLPVAIHGRVHQSDPNGNCFVIGVETPPIPGVTLLLKDSQGTVVAQTVTDAGGRYAFTGLAPGTYTVVEIQPEGYYNGGQRVGWVNGVTTGYNADEDVIAGITLMSGQVGLHYDFCEHLPGSLSGYVYHDRNNDGLRAPGEEGISGVTLRLVDAGGAEVATAVTNAQGFYQFTNLRAGNYTVIESQPAGWLDGLDAAGTIGGVVVGAAQNPGDQIGGVTLSWGQSGVEYNFGELLPVEIHGHVRESDPYGNCFVIGIEHTPIAGVTLLLRDEAGNVIAQTQTNTDGAYSFVGLMPGVYTVEEIQPQGYLNGSNRVGWVDGAVTGAALSRDIIAGIELASGQKGIHYDFCEHVPSTISGYVYHDANNNGVKEAGESPIAGSRLTLVDAEGTVVAIATTNAQGYYEFTMLGKGVYSIIQTQPEGYFDGLDAAGTIDGVVVGQAENPGDRIDQIAIGYKQNGINYNFGELLPGSIAGRVFLDPNRNLVLDSGESPIAGVTVQLLGSGGGVVATTTTDAAGTYQFVGLPPGMYSVKLGPTPQYFHGGQVVGSGDGQADVDNLLYQINIGSDQHLVEYNFAKIPPSMISGYVFVDGPVIYTSDGTPPENLFDIRTGVRKPGDLPIAGVTLELRNGVTGEPINASMALPGVYGDGPIRVVTDANGHYSFTGLRWGNYAVFQVHPEGYFDGIDTPGTTSGIAVNRGADINPAILQMLMVDPKDDAILRIAVAPGVHSMHNNFSEIIVRQEPPPPPPPPPPPLVELTPPPPPAPVLAPPPTWLPPREFHSITPQAQSIYGISAYTWHLSVVNSGKPRAGANIAESDGEAPIWLTGTRLAGSNWEACDLGSGQWTLASTRRGEGQVLALGEYIFGLPGGIPVAGDFNGDGTAELGIFYKGEWFIDLNGNGVWDRDDLWAKLGHDGDLPVVGDWDGDGKADIGIFGPAWPGDPRAVAAEPGLPAAANLTQGKEKNVPPQPEEAAQGRRVMQLTSAGKLRADLIDHVFYFGAAGDIPVVGDWNGDGTPTIGVFRGGRWNLDIDGDGRWTEVDRVAQFGQAGDLPVVGDWNGDGVSQIGVYRNGKWILDTNGNLELDATDKVFELGGPGDLPVVGDWDGDGIDDVGIYRPGVGAELRQAMRAN